MMSFLQHRSRRHGYCGWALLMPGASKPLAWTVSTTREEVRELRKLRGDLFEKGAKEVKVEIIVKVVEPKPRGVDPYSFPRLMNDYIGVRFRSARGKSGGEVAE